MHNAILASSVHIPILPLRVSNILFFICLSTSLKSYFIKWSLFFSNGINYVDAPNASQIAKPSKQATPRFVFIPNYKVLEL